MKEKGGLVMPDDDRQQSTRHRRSERYIAEIAAQPSMSAPQPMPGRGGGANVPKKPEPAAAPAPYGMNEPEAPCPPSWYSEGNAPVYTGQAEPSQPHGAQPGWSQPYIAQPQQGWSQPYAAQPQQGSWSQPYPVQPQAGWSQPYGAPQQGWSQPQQPQNGWQGVPPFASAAGQNSRAAQMPEYGKASGSSGGGKGRMSGVIKLAVLLVAAIGAIVALVLGITSINQSNAQRQAVEAYNDRFCEGVYVDGIHLGGMTQQEAVNAVVGSAQQRLQSWNVRLTYEGGLIRTITAGDLGMTVNVQEALEEAWQQGHESSNVEARLAAMNALLDEPYEGYTALPSGDTSAIDKILGDLAAVVYSAPQDAYVSAFNPDAHSDPFVIEPEQMGRYLDVESAKEEIYAMVENMENGSIELKLRTIMPTVTEADLRKARTLRGSALTEISTTSTAERNANIERAFSLINGTTLKPGESFSFNTIVGARTAKNGFYKAIEYAYGQEREGYGGGVCQASTTIYLAAVRANLQIVKREPHSDKVNYTAYGLDATVNYDGKKIDLVFKNDSGSNIYILSYLVRANGRWNCKVDIYGEAFEEGVTYDLVAETVEILPAPVDPEYVNDETGEHVMYIDDPPVQKEKARDGVVVETFKVKYVNKVEVERTYMARDTYKAKAQKLWVGVHEREDALTN